jgi:hypothetical protein
MNTITKFFTALALVSVVFLVQCKKDPVDKCTGFNFSAEIQDELTAFSNAATTYGQDQSVANCNAYKNAGIAYVNALEDLEECAVLGGQNQQQYQQDIDDARASFQAIVC